MILFSFKTNYLFLCLFIFTVQIGFCQRNNPTKFDTKEYYDGISIAFKKSNDKIKFIEAASDSVITYKIGHSLSEKMLTSFLKYLTQNKQKIPYKLYLALAVEYLYLPNARILSMTYVLKALQSKDIIQNPNHKIIAYEILTYFFYDLNDFEQTEYYFKKLEEIFHSENVKKIVIDNIGINNTIGMMYFKKQEYEKANIYFKKTIKLAEIKKDTFWIGLIKGNLGSSYLKQKKYKEALPLLEYDIKTSIKYKQYGNAVLSLSDIIYFYIEQNNFSKAESIVVQGLNLLDSLEQKKIEKMPSFFNFYDVISVFYETKKQFEKALDYKKKSEEIRTEYENIKKDENIQRLRFKYNHEKDLLALDELTKQNETQQFFLYLVGITLLFVVILSIILFQRYNQKRKSNQLLFKKNRDIETQKYKIISQSEILTSQNIQINLQNNELQSLNQTKNKLFSLIAHDLRAPLVTLRGVLNLLKDNNLSFAEFQNILPTLDDNVYKTLILTDDLLYWGKMQLEGITITLSKINTNEFIDQKAERMRSLAKAKNIEIQVNSLSQPQKIWADEEMLKAICRNLISNSIKFCDENQKIILSLQDNPNQKFVTFIIEDTGVGISNENIDKLFSGRIFTTRGTKGEKGTGFGLMLCKDFVELNGGQIWVESELGKGSKFYFTMPLFENQDLNLNTNE